MFSSGNGPSSSRQDNSVSIPQLYKKAWALLKENALVIVPLSLVLLIPLYVFANDATHSIFLALLEAEKQFGVVTSGSAGNLGEEEAQALFMMVAPPIFRFLGMSILFITVGSYLYQTTVLFSTNTYHGDGYSLSHLIKKSLGKSFVHTLLQAFIVGIIVAISMFFIALVGGIVGSVGGGVFALLLEIVFGIALIYTFTLIIFGVHNIVENDRGPWKGIIASIVTVRHHWRAVFLALFPSIILLVALMFAVSSQSPAFTGSSQVPIEALEHIVNHPSGLALAAVQAGWLTLLYILFANILTPLHDSLQKRQENISTTFDAT